MQKGGFLSSSRCLSISFIIFYDLYVLKGRGTVATGRIEQGIIKAGEDVEILGLMQVKFVILF